jgi:hypothetical protein
MLILGPQEVVQTLDSELNQLVRHQEQYGLLQFPLIVKMMLVDCSPLLQVKQLVKHKEELGIWQM